MEGVQTTYHAVEQRNDVSDGNNDAGRTGLLHGQEAPKRDAKVRTATAAPSQEPALGYNFWLLAVLFAYVIFLLIPWSLTCLTNARPLGLPSYINQAGLTTLNDVQNMENSQTVIRILSSIASLITVPTISILLGQAAVVYTQRRKSRSRLNLAQTFALADRRWESIPTLLTILGYQPKIVYGDKVEVIAAGNSLFLWLAAGLLLLGAAQQPIQQLFVATETVLIPTCLDLPILIDSSCSEGLDGSGPTDIGYEPQASDLAQIPQNNVVQAIARDISTVAIYDEQSNFWPNGPSRDGGQSSEFALGPDSQSSQRNSFYWYPDYFASALSNGTNTGVLREHSMRLNSSATCELIDQDAYPISCPGELPFVTEFAANPDLTISICVPGNYTKQPWTTSSDRQDIHEDLYINVQSDSSSSTTKSYISFAVHCGANTTRGYFELGNYQNGYTAGPLLDESPFGKSGEFNDYIEVQTGANGEPVPLPGPVWGSSIDPFNTPNIDQEVYLPNPGPLTTSAIAIFGNQSFFYTAANSSDYTSVPSTVAQICQRGALPFSDYANTGFTNYCLNINDPAEQELGGFANSSSDRLVGLMYEFILNFNDTTWAETGLGMAMFFSNRAALTITAQRTSTMSARLIYSGTGTYVSKPAVSQTGIIVVSAFILLQLVALLFLTVYMYSSPTWTTALDSFAVARMIATSEDLKDEIRGGEMKLPPLSRRDDEKYWAKLAALDGLVGLEVAEGGEEGEGEGEEERNEGEKGKARTTQLKLGAPGLINRKTRL